jgi:hypothetical protein
MEAMVRDMGEELSGRPVTFRGCAAARVAVIAVEAPSRLPPAAGTYSAIGPACNETGGDEPDRATTVLRLGGLPPHVAVGARDRPAWSISPRAR